MYTDHLQLKECDLKADTPSSVDQSPAAIGKGRGKGQRRPRKPKAAAGQVPVNPMALGQSPMGQGQQGMPMQTVPGPSSQMGHMGVYGQGPGGMQQQGQQFGNNPGQQQWYNQQQQQQGYFPPQMSNGECFNRFLKIKVLGEFVKNYKMWQEYSKMFVN